MNRCLFILLSSLISCAWANTEYREFKDVQGRVIRARILEYDEHAEMVTMQRDNGVEATVPLSIFSEEDRTFIQNMGKASEEELASAVSLSPREKRAFARKYIELLVDEDYEALKELLHGALPPDNHLRKCTKRIVDCGGADIDGAEGYNIHVELNSIVDERVGLSGCIQLTPAGKIKYCFLVAPHPIDQAASVIRALFDMREADEEVKAKRIKEIESTGVPTFGLNSRMTKMEMLKTLKEIRKWLLDNGENFDTTEPKLFLSKKHMRMVRRDLKRMF